MSIKNEVDIIRKENLKLNKKDTKLVFALKSSSEPNLLGSIAMYKSPFGPPFEPGSPSPLNTTV